MRYHIVKQSRGYRGGTKAGANDLEGNPLIRETLEEAIEVCDQMSKRNPVGYEVHEEKEIGDYSEPIYKYEFKNETNRELSHK